MKKIEALCPLLLLFFIPFWHLSKMNETPLLLYQIISYKGIFAFICEMIPFSFFSLIVIVCFYLFINYCAFRISLFISSLLLIAFHYLFLSPSFFYDNMPVFLCLSFLCFKGKKQPQHLFFSLYFITVGFLTSCFFYDDSLLWDKYFSFYLNDTITFISLPSFFKRYLPFKNGIDPTICPKSLPFGLYSA